jgi:hypothetical protein
MDRLTIKHGDNYKCHISKGMSNDEYFDAIIVQLGEYEDKIENGSLVEVVRCKNCEYLSEHGCCIYIGNMRFDEEEYAYYSVLHPEDDEFCSHGKLKESEKK